MIVLKILLVVLVVVCLVMAIKVIKVKRSMQGNIDAHKLRKLYKPYLFFVVLYFMVATAIFTLTK